MDQTTNRTGSRVTRPGSRAVRLIALAALVVSALLAVAPSGADSGPP